MVMGKASNQVILRFKNTNNVIIVRTKYITEHIINIIFRERIPSIFKSSVLKNNNQVEINIAKANTHMYVNFCPCDLSYSFLNINLIGISIVILFSASNGVEQLC